MSTFYLPKLLSREGKVSGIAKFLLALSPGKAWKIEVTEHRASRSDQQNAYLWGCAYKHLSRHTGYETDELHDYLLGRYFGEREKRVPKSANYPNGIKRVPNRTTTTDETGKRDVLTWDAFGEYVAFVQRIGAKAGCFIPDPDPNWRENEQQEAA